MPTTGLRLHLLLVAAVTTIATGTPADAALFTSVFTGTITSGQDVNNIFKAGHVLDGLSYTATYFIDDNKGVKSYYYAESTRFSYSQILGGSSYGQSESSPVTAILKINETTMAFSGLGTSIHYIQDNGGNPSNFDRIWSQASDVNGSESLYFDYYNFLGTLINSHIGSPVDFFSDQGDYQYGSFTIGGAVGQLGISQIVIGPFQAAAVPEPASWALMIGGFGIAGGALRRRSAHCKAASLAA